jgi:hypothetical protein
MPMLGDMLASARSLSDSFQAWLERSDPQLATQVKLAAAAQGLTPTGYVRAAVADFGRFAAEEDWATLTSSLRDSDDPGTTCLLAMVHWRLTARSCREHSPMPEDDHEPTVARRTQGRSTQSGAEDRNGNGLSDYGILQSTDRHDVG